MIEYDTGEEHDKTEGLSERAFINPVTGVAYRARRYPNEVEFMRMDTVKELVEDSFENGWLERSMFDDTEKSISYKIQQRYLAKFLKRKEL